MTESWMDRVQRVFTEAADAPAAQRASVIEARCGDDARLRSEVESLLRADSAYGTFMLGGAEPALLGVPRTPGRIEAGQRVGAYVLDEPLGEGGMGTVYRAHRADGSYSQEVAIKVIRDPLSSADVEDRFVRERQVLASLRHENIARLIDGGISADHPYLVMELIRGRNLLAYCDERNLCLERRLALFDEVCAGVQHAHTNLVVHRDLKPAHVVVGDDGRPKLLDFGIAVILDADTGTGGTTQTIHRRLTPQYASPEQLAAEPVTTASDVYALGLILYELTCGRRAYQVKSSPTGPLLPEQTPALPSKRALEDREGAGAHVAAARGVSPRKLAQELDGDLDLIVMTALRREAGRRYPSAGALREDLRRYRDGLPIVARPDSWGYRARKFVRRNRVGVSAAAVVLLVLISAIVAVGRQAGIARAQRAEAQERRSDAEAALATSDRVGQFLRSVLVAADPRNQGQDATVREALDAGAARIEGEFGENPEVEARVREAIGMTYRSLGVLDRADVHLTRAHDLALRTFPNGAEANRMTHELGVLRLDQGRIDEARELSTAAFDERVASDGEVSARALETRNVLALIALREENHDEALAHAKASTSGWSELFGPQHPTTLEYLNTQGEILFAMAQYDEAAEVFRRVYDGQSRVLGSDHPDTLITVSDLGTTLKRLGRTEEALEWQMRSLEGLGAMFPAGSLDVVIPRINIAVTLLGLERCDEALNIALPALEHGAPALGEGHYVVAAARLTVGRALVGLGRTEDARAHLLRAQADLNATVGPEHSLTKTAAGVLAELDGSGG
ncbi:MAG: serine/threonine-protein kinase [Planctomycetota bacterium]